MNINLLSPTDSNNGSSYNVRFRENIRFKPNSKVYLNYATFTRENEVSFSEPQTITMKNIKMFPEFQPANPATPNIPATVSIEIPVKNPLTNENSYTFDQLQQVIGDKFDALTTQNPLKMYKAFDENTALDLGERDVGIGYYVDNPLQREFHIDASNSRDANSDGNNVYFKNSATGTTGARTFGYDNYAISGSHFFHPLTECETFADESTVFCEVNKAVNELTGGVVFGLYSAEYTANEVGGNNTERTQGTGATTGSTNSNPQVKFNGATVTSGDVNFSKAYPALFLSVEVTPTSAQNAGDSRGGLDGSTIIRVAKSAAANTSIISSWTSINNDIAGMKNIFSIKNSQLVGASNLDNSVRLLLKTYYTNANGDLTTDKRRLHFKLINLSKNMASDDPANLIYDSKNHGVYFDLQFFNGLAVAGSAAEKSNILNSQIPFNVFASAQVQNEGFKYLSYTDFDKTEGTNASPLSILNTYQLEFSSELARYAGVSESNVLWANSCEVKAEYFHIRNFNLDWANDSFSILLKNLPIKNFKNTGKESNGGFGKAIIANVPSPFRDSIEQILGNKKVITGIFQPNYPVELDLNNNAFELNNFDISIVNMRDETEVTELIKSNVSFTIKN